MLTYAQRHGLNQDDIEAHKEARRKAKPFNLTAEKVRLERLRGIKQTELDEIDESLTMIGKSEQTLGNSQIAKKGE